MRFSKFPHDRRHPRLPSISHPMTCCSDWVMSAAAAARVGPCVHVVAPLSSLDSQACLGKSLSLNSARQASHRQFASEPTERTSSASLSILNCMRHGRIATEYRRSIEAPSFDSLLAHKSNITAQSLPATRVGNRDMKAAIRRRSSSWFARPRGEAPTPSAILCTRASPLLMGTGSRSEPSPNTSYRAGTAFMTRTMGQLIYGPVP